MKSILVTGGTGIVGKAIESIRKEYKYNFIFINSKMCNLADYTQTFKLIQQLTPIIIIHIEACIDGLYKNMNQKVKILEENILINTNVIKAAHENGVNEIISCLCTCSFQDNPAHNYLINESILYSGQQHSLEEQCRMYRETFNRRYFCVISENIYGPFGNFNLEDGHVIQSLIHKAYLSKQNGLPFEIREIEKPLRKFIYSVDVARLIIELLKTDFNENIILSPPDEHSIEHVSKIINKHFDNQIVFNQEYSDGQYKKTADNSKLNFLNFKFTELEEGIDSTVKWFIENYDTIRK